MQQLWQRELPFLRLQTGLKSQSVSIFNGKTDSFAVMCARGKKIKNKIIPSKFKIILKGVMRLRNQIPRLWRANICRLHKHRVYSTEHNAANDGLYFWGIFFVVFVFFFFFNVQIQGNVKKIIPLYNLSPLVMSPISGLLEFCGWHMFVLFFGGLASLNIRDVSSETHFFNPFVGLKLTTLHPEWLWHISNGKRGTRWRMRDL